MKAYKLFRILKDGSISSLFINKKERYNIGEWMDFKDIPTIGFKHRPGWHSLENPIAPHLSKQQRAWFEVEIDSVTIEQRPINQGGKWFLSKRLKILKKYEEN